MGKYKDMIVQARLAGTTSENTMWSSIDDVDDLLEIVEKLDEEKYWEFIRKTYESLFGCHYNESFAKNDVKNMWHTDRNGIRQEGEHWTIEEVKNATSSLGFKDDVTDWDKYVALHVAWHDLSKSFTDDECIKFAYQFFFCDEDFPDGKVWCYVAAM